MQSVQSQCGTVADEMKAIACFVFVIYSGVLYQEVKRIEETDISANVYACIIVPALVLCMLPLLLLWQLEILDCCSLRCFVLCC